MNAPGREGTMSLGQYTSSSAEPDAAVLGEGHKSKREARLELGNSVSQRARPRGDVPPPLATSFTTALETTSTQQHISKARAMGQNEAEVQEVGRRALLQMILCPIGQVSTVSGRLFAMADTATKPKYQWQCGRLPAQTLGRGGRFPHQSRGRRSAFFVPGAEYRYLVISTCHYSKNSSPA